MVHFAWCMVQDSITKTPTALRDYRDRRARIYHDMRIPRLLNDHLPHHESCEETILSKLLLAVSALMT